jgi:hypothetical protein
MVEGRRYRVEKTRYKVKGIRFKVKEYGRREMVSILGGVFLN